MIPPFDHPDVIAGQGTIGLEILEQRPEVDTILVPVSGSHASREAAELAFRIASDQDIVVLLQVVATGGDDAARIGSASSEQRRMKTATEIVDGLADVARAQGVRTLPIVRAGVDVEHVGREVDEEVSTGMDVLGTAVRAGSGRLFLGPRVEWMLENIRCPVLVYNAAPGPGID